MKELLYFSFADLMARVEYHQDANSLRYATHRKMSHGERVVVEQYILTNLGPKTDYYKRLPAMFIYIGLEAQLVKELNLFHLKNTLKTLVEKEKDVKSSVDGLISQSMQNYYFEQIGDAILAARREVQNAEARPDEQLEPLKIKLEELVKAYNAYSDQKITIHEIIPSELKSYFGMTTEAAFFVEAPEVRADAGARF